jgi:uncharacterized protein with WD repeat
MAIVHQSSAQTTSDPNSFLLVFHIILVTYSFPSRTQGLQIQFSADGKLLAVVKPTGAGISIIDVATSKEVQTIAAANVMGVAFSPKSTFLQTFQKPGGQGEKNLTIWSLATAEPVFQQFQKSFSKLSW